MKINKSKFNKKLSRGFILPMTLIFVLILLVIALAVYRNNILQTRMNGNTHDKEIAFQSAEAGLRLAEKYLKDNAINKTDFKSDCTGGLCLPSTPNVWMNAAKKWSNAKSFNPNLPNITLKAAPQALIELLPNGANREQIYRITVLASGAREETQVMLQSVYLKP